MDVHQLLAFAVDNGAAELLCSAGVPPAMRKSGSLVRTRMDPLTSEVIDDMVRQVLGPERAADLDNRSQLDFVYAWRPGVTWRVSLFTDRGHRGAAFRLLSTGIPSPEKLLLPPVVRRVVESGRGLILLGAAPGHGRSTSLLSLADVVNRQREAHILTLERRLKVLLAPDKSVIFQREIGAQDLPAALAAAVDQDPDLLMVTHLVPAMLHDVLQLAARGRLVLCGCDAGSTLQVIHHVLSGHSGEALTHLRAELGVSLRLVLAQQLLPGADSKGSFLAGEVLSIGPDQARLLRTGDFASLTALLQKSGIEDVLSMDRCIQLLVRRELVSRAIARRYMNDEKLLES